MLVVKWTIITLPLREIVQAEEEKTSNLQISDSGRVVQDIITL